MTTNTKAIIEANKRHIIRQYHGTANFVDEVDHLMRSGYGTPYRVVMTMAEGGSFLIYTADIVAYLKRIGLKDMRKMEQYRGGLGGPTGLYFALIARDGAKLYEEAKKKEKAKRKG